MPNKIRPRGGARLAAVFFMLCLTFAAAEDAAKPRCRLDVRYTSRTGIDAAVIGFDSRIVNALDGIGFVLSGERENALPTLTLNAACVETVQMSMNGKLYDIHTATIKAKVLVAAPDGTILWSMDLQAVKEKGGTPKDAELKAARAFADQLAARLREKQAELVAAIGKR